MNKNETPEKGKVTKEDILKKRVTTITMVVLAPILAFLILAVVGPFLLQATVSPGRMRIVSDYTPSLDSGVSNVSYGFFLDLLSATGQVLMIMALHVGLVTLVENFRVFLRLIATPIAWLIVLLIKQSGWLKDSGERIRIYETESTLFSGLLKISDFLFSKETQDEIFVPITQDRRVEYNDALLEKRSWKARWVNVRYVYIFIFAMVEASFIGDLIEFIRKIAK